MSDLGLKAIRNQKSKIENRVAWLALDQDDNDLTRFLTALIASLQRLNPACGAAVTARLNASPASPSDASAQARRVVSALVNDILETLPDPFVLILDDLHYISAATIYVALDYALERLPPQMRMIVAARHDPPLALARLRARGQLAELRLPDLRFTLEETSSLVNDRLRLALADADLGQLQSRTEGWPAGLRLLAASLEHIPDPAGRATFIAHRRQPGVDIHADGGKLCIRQS